jgi:acyl-coenzyme A synthetase/AMP-(fatty) acid ligase
MLYDRWRQLAREFSHELALRDLATRRDWTFAQLAAEAESTPPADGPVVFPQGTGDGFILTVLRAWRDGWTVCPLEAGQAPPTVNSRRAGCSSYAHLKLTSGSTGAPRLIAFTAEQLAADAENIVATMGLRRDWPNLGVISLAHSYGFSNLVTPLLLHGIPLILARSALPESVLEASQTAPDLALAAVPALWRAWHEANAIPGNVRLAISAGAPLPLALERAVFDAGGLKIHNFYGASECGGIAYDGSATPRPDASCVGAPMANVQLACNADGCLEVRSRAVGSGYFPEADPALGSGVFRTSDLAELRDGLVFLRGRAGDLINVAGRKISPEAIERALLAHPAVRECLVFGLPNHDDARTEIIVGVVATRAPVDEAGLKQFLLRALPAWQVPREWRFVESLEVNARGKLSRAEWRRNWRTWNG